jgi:ABC-2 type transport system ATP-binding protein
MAPSDPRQAVSSGTPTPPNAEWAVRTEHLTKIYGNRLIAVNDMSLRVPRGSIFGLLGPNGAGKTTTIKLLLGLQRPTAGRAEVFGRPCGPNAIGVRSLIGYLPTHPMLPENLRPTEYLDLLGQLCRLPREFRKPRFASLLRAVGLLGATDQRIGTFSTGMCTRLGIAASLVGDPPLLLWDEPTAGLDPSARRFTIDLIRQLGKSRTVVVATHILSDIDQICDHVGVMHEGRMIFTGAMHDMKQRLRRDEFNLELEGASEDLLELAQQADAMEGITARAQADHTLVVRLSDSQSRAAALADVLGLVESSRLTLTTIHSGHNETENAYLQLLQEDEAHGFQRFDLDARHPADAVPGDPPA